MDFKQADFFEHACTAVVLSLLTSFNKIKEFICLEYQQW